MTMSRRGLVGLGYISGIYGVRGWVKVFSWTRPPERILDYSRWLIGPERAGAADTQAPLSQYSLHSGRMHGKGLVAQLSDVEDRDRAAALIGQHIYVARDDLPATAAGEFYWADLVGLEVRNRQGVRLGVVDHLLETGAHDVLALDSGANHLIPFVHGDIVRDVDLDGGVISVDWDPAWWE